jgi:hypothetical protein
MTNKRILSEKQLREFLYCPLRYSVIFQNKTALPEPLTMNGLLNRVARSFFLELLGGKVRPVYWLKRKWDALCNKYPGYLNDKRVVHGIAVLNNFYKYCRDNEVQIVDINSPYEIQFPSVCVRGTLGAVSMKNKKFELLIMDFSNQMPDQSLIDLKLEYTLQCYAFRTLYSHDITGIRYVHLKSNTDFLSIRGRNDYLRLETIVEHVAGAIEHQYFYPHETVLCKNCTSKDVCRMWF